MIKRLAFFIGLLLGLASIIQAGTAILTYFLTGKLTSVEIQETDGGRRPVFKLVSADDVLEIIKDQAAKGRIRIQFDQAPSEPEQEESDAG
jgi:hypothetical protein